jgi:hypothetical protein
MTYMRLVDVHLNPARRHPRWTGRRHRRLTKASHSTRSSFRSCRLAARSERSSTPTRKTIHRTLFTVVANHATRTRVSADRTSREATETTKEILPVASKALGYTVRSFPRLVRSPLRRLARNSRPLHGHSQLPHRPPIHRSRETIPRQRTSLHTHTILIALSVRRVRITLHV